LGPGRTTLENDRKLDIDERYAFLYSTSITISKQGPINATLVNIMCSLRLQQHVSAALHGHHQVVVQIRKKKSSLGKGLHVTDTKYNIFVV
jgi:hypothetical protein